MARPKLDLTGQRYGRLVVLARADRAKPYWLCRCDCGNEKEVHQRSLRYQNTRSCGCLIRESTGQRSLTHGHARKGAFTPTYIVWAKMLSDAGSSTNKGCGAHEVDGRWSDFATFLADMGPKPDGQTLRRIGETAPFGPENCGWQPVVRVYRKPRLLTNNGKTQSAAEWARELNVTLGCIYKRLRKGLPLEDALR